MPLTKAQAQRLIQEAVAAVQATQPTWTEADLIRHLGERLPAQIGAMTQQDAAALLPALARQALAGEGNAVMLSAPEWPRVPDCLRRASGESLYVPHGAARYATGAQLTLEDRLLDRRAGARCAAPGTRHSGAPARRGPGAAGSATRGARPPARTPSASSPVRACAWTRPPPRTSCSPPAAAPR